MCGGPTYKSVYGAHLPQDGTTTGQSDAWGHFKVATTSWFAPFEASPLRMRFSTAPHGVAMALNHGGCATFWQTTAIIFCYI